MGIEETIKRAEAGDVKSQILLAKRYGHSSNADYKEAAKWWTKAAEQGNVDAQFILGECYYYGTGVEKDYVAAVEWFSKAAEWGWGESSTSAQFYLGFCYENGLGVAKNLDVAVSWYRELAKQGYVSAKEALKRLGINEY